MFVSVSRRRPVTAVRVAIAFAIVVVAVLATATASRAAATADTGATVTAEKRVDSQTLDITIKSPSTEQDTRTVRLLVPSGWSPTATRTWPVLFLLHGGFDSYTSWSSSTNVKSLAASRQVIVAMPDTSWCSSYSDWWNYGSGGRPKWETFITTEVRQILERGYRASTSRAVAGNSMGGLGAMKFAANGGAMFKAAASFSGDDDPLHQYAGGTGVTTPGLSCGSDWKRVWGDPAIPAQRLIWQRNDPWNQAEGLRGKSLFISSGGTGDMVEAQVDKESKGLATRLSGLGIPATTDFYTGNHNWTYWGRELGRAWGQLMTAIGA